VPISLPVGRWLSWIPGVPADMVFNVHTYALCIILGITLAIILTNRRLVKRGGEPWALIDVAIWAVVLGIVGSRG